LSGSRHRSVGADAQVRVRRKVSGNVLDFLSVCEAKANDEPNPGEAARPQEFTPVD
jgi:hypothetical protein